MIVFMFYPDTKLPHLYSYESTVLIMNTGRVWLPVYAVARLYGCSCRAFGWLVKGWGLSHAVQDSLVSQANSYAKNPRSYAARLVRAQQACGRDMSVRQRMLTCSEPDEISEQPGSL